MPLTLPVRRGDKLVLELGDTYFEVADAHGARVTSLRSAGRELLSLTGPADNPDMYGSTFWPSPQAAWPGGWPPPAELDSGPYSATIDGEGRITAVSAPYPALGLRVTKQFCARPEREAIEIEYTLANTGGVTRSVAPWEITRVPPGGVAFWPTGGEPFGPSPRLSTEAALGHTWCTPRATPGTAKVFADGAGGWLAYACDGLLLVKQFQDQPASAAAPGEAEVEIYIDRGHSYVEVEQQGAFGALSPGAATRWRVTWYARKLPPRLSVAAGSADLVAFVAETLQ